MKLNNFQKNFYIFSSIIISIFIGALLWEKIILPFNNTIGARGALVTEGYNPTNDVIRYIFFISFPLIVFLFLNLVLKKKTINIRELIFEKEKDVEIINKHQVLIIVAFIFVIFIILEFLSLKFPITKLDQMHDGAFLSPAQNYLSTKNFWISSYLTHGGSDIFYPLLMWKILGVESIGAARSVFVFSILFVKLLTVLLSYQLTKISNLNSESKILFFTIFTSILISMSHYNLQSDGRYFSSRDLYVILFLIFFIELFIHSKFRPFFIILISLIATISILLHIDTGIYLNFVLIFYFLYLLFIKKYDDILLIFFSLIISWFIVIQLIGFDEFRTFLDNSKIILFSFDFMHGIKYPEPFFSMGDDPNGARATRGLILQLTAGLLVLNYLISNESEIVSSKKMLFVFLFLLSFIAYKNALSRSDAGHIRMSNDLPILINCFFILNYLLFFLEKKNIIKKFLSDKYFFSISIIFLVFFYIINNNYGKIENIKNFKQNFTNYINYDDKDFLDQKTIKLVNYYKQISEKDSCVTSISYDMDAINYLLKKPSCTKYWSSWLTSPIATQKDYIRQLRKNQPQYILHISTHKFDGLDVPSRKFDGLEINERIELIHAYILSNYKKYDQLDGYIILEKR